MLKGNRKAIILKMLDSKEFVKVTDLQKQLDVTEMTIRRDLKDMEEEGLLVRVHGGAMRNGEQIVYTELEHGDRKHTNEDKKREIAKKCSDIIQDDDILFISASTTNEYIYEYIQAKNVRIITNCLYIYFQFRKDTRFDTILVGGKFDDKIESFLGAIAIEVISKINFTKAFVGTNGICNNNLSASNEEEGWLHRQVLDNAKEKFIVCDSTKFQTDSYYNFYTCDKLTAVISNDSLNSDYSEIERYTKVI
ncbi:DeoR/GlpR family DNA-binding transcription regulator [Amedibacillus sp. YH-ame10]